MGNDVGDEFTREGLSIDGVLGLLLLGCWLIYWVIHKIFIAPSKAEREAMERSLLAWREENYRKEKSRLQEIIAKVGTQHSPHKKWEFIKSENGWIGRLRDRRTGEVSSIKLDDPTFLIDEGDRHESIEHADVDFSGFSSLDYKQPTAAIIVARDRQFTPNVDGKKWEWSKGKLMNRRTGQSFSPTQAKRDEEMHCFEFANDQAYVRAYDNEVDFGEALHKCAKCGSRLYQMSGVEVEKCEKCGHMNNVD